MFSPLELRVFVFFNFKIIFRNRQTTFNTKSSLVGLEKPELPFLFYFLVCRFHRATIGVESSSGGCVEPKLKLKSKKRLELELKFFCFKNY